MRETEKRQREEEEALKEFEKKKIAQEKRKKTQQGKEKEYKELKPKAEKAEKKRKYATSSEDDQEEEDDDFKVKYVTICNWSRCVAKGEFGRSINPIQTRAGQIMSNILLPAPLPPGLKKLSTVYTSVIYSLKTFKMCYSVQLDFVLTDEYYDYSLLIFF